MATRDHLLRLAVLGEFAPRLAATVTRLGGDEEALAQVLRGDDPAAERARRFLRAHPPDAVRDAADRAGLRILYRGSGDYPPPLLTTPHPPPVLFANGRVPRSWAGATAIVGSRRVSAGSRVAAERFAASVAVRGGVVVSGMAYGIDAAAHRGAIAAGGITVAVLASGADRPSPAGARPLYRAIAGGGGVVLSEYLPGSEARPYRFPVRNRLIAGLAERCLVVEAGARSGALHTVDHAVAMGREVLVYPCDGLRPSARGSNRLIQEGAQVVIEPSDLFLPRGAEGRSDSGGGGDEGRIPPIVAGGRDGLFQRVWGCLEGRGSPLDVVARSAGMSVPLVRAVVVEMELLGLVRLEGGVVKPVGYNSTSPQPGPHPSGGIGASP